MSQELSVDISKQAISSGYLQFFELEIGSGSVNKLYFHDGKNENSADITFDGNTYISLPIQMTGVEVTTTGTINRPSLTVANVESVLKSQSKFKTEMREADWDASVGGLGITNSNFRLDDLIGSRLVRRRTLEKYLTSNPTVEFPKDTYIIDRIATKTSMYVSFELSSPHDLIGFRLPSRAVVGKYCPWKYQGAASNVIASDRQGACVWKTNEQINLGSSTASVYFTENDEPIIKATALASASSAYNNSTTYSADAIVLDNGIYYQSMSDSNQGNARTNEVFWRILRSYTVWSSDTGVTYTIDTDDPAKNSYVLHDNTIWRALVGHTRSATIEPDFDSPYWSRADICGKLIKSCKLRYQARGINNDSGTNFIPSTTFSTSAVLPFGGFPGSRKFR